MLQLSSLLERFKHLAPTESLSRKAVLSVVQEVCGFLLKDGDVRIERGTVLLHVHPIRRIEILQRKQEILQLLKEKHLLVLSDVR